jgi:hypothetical protein
VWHQQAAEADTHLLTFSVDGVVQQSSSSIAVSYLAPSASSLLAALGLTVVDASMQRIAGECRL